MYANVEQSRFKGVYLVVYVESIYARGRCKNDIGRARNER